MYRTRLSRASLAALAIAALASGSTFATSSGADASPRIDPGFGRGPPRIDPGFGNGTKIDPGFGKNSGPTFTVKQIGQYDLRSNCRWTGRQGVPQPKHPGPGMGQNSGMVKVCY